MNKYTIWYMKPEFFRDGTMGPQWLAAHQKMPDHNKLADTHIELKKIEASSLKGVFYGMQAEVWSQLGEARELIESKGLHHTSMSVGDIAVDEQGVASMVDRMGWFNVNQYWEQKAAWEEYD